VSRVRAGVAVGKLGCLAAHLYAVLCMSPVLAYNLHKHPETLMGGGGDRVAGNDELRVAHPDQRH